MLARDGFINFDIDVAIHHFIGVYVAVVHGVVSTLVHRSKNNEIIFIRLSTF